MPENEHHYTKKIKRANIYLVVLIIIIITVIALLLIL